MKTDSPLQLTDSERLLLNLELNRYSSLLASIREEASTSLNSGIELICTGNAGGVDNVVNGRASSGFRMNYSGRKIQVDPGHGTLIMLNQLGINPYDTTDVIGTHAHNDHTSELGAIVSAIRRLNLRDSDSHTVVNPTLAAYTGDSTKNGFVLPAYAWEKGHVAVLHPQEFQVDRWDGIKTHTSRSHRINDDINLIATRCIHNEPFAIGMVIDTPLGRLGYTGDTEWYDGLPTAFEGCDSLWININTLGLSSSSGKSDAILNLGSVKNHLGYAGVCALIEIVKPSTAIISHFGSQLQSMIPDIEENLRARYSGMGINTYCARNGQSFTFNYSLRQEPESIRLEERLQVGYTLKLGIQSSAGDYH